jgi:hypothetical protein
MVLCRSLNIATAENCWCRWKGIDCFVLLVVVKYVKKGVSCSAITYNNKNQFKMNLVGMVFTVDMFTLPQQVRRTNRPAV